MIQIFPTGFRQQKRKKKEKKDSSIKEMESENDFLCSSFLLTKHITFLLKTIFL